MQFIFDNLNAVLVSGTVVLLSSALLLNQSRTRLETAEDYSAHLQQQELVRWIESDLMALGAGTPAGELPVETTSSGIVFYTVADPRAGSLGRVEYRLTDAGSARTLERRVNGQVTGRSGLAMQRARFLLLDDAGAPTAPGPSVRQIRVELAWASDRASGSATGSGTRTYVTTVRPFNLRDLRETL
ncbi:MAG: hypothetical protein ACK41D_11965 [Rubricoccaceae bacterium]